MLAYIYEINDVNNGIKLKLKTINGKHVKQKTIDDIVRCLKTRKYLRLKTIMRIST